MSGSLCRARHVNEGAPFWVPGPGLVGDAVPGDVAAELFTRDTRFPLNVRASINRDLPLTAKPLAHGWLRNAQFPCQRRLAAEVFNGLLDRVHRPMIGIADV